MTSRRGEVAELRAEVAELRGEVAELARQLASCRACSDEVYEAGYRRGRAGACSAARTAPLAGGPAT